MAPKLRVLTLIDELSADGGAERLAIGIATRLDRNRFEPAVCVTRETNSRGQDALVRRLQEDRVELIYLGRKTARDLKAWLPVLRRLRRGEFDVVHSHKFGSNVWAGVLSILAPGPVYIAHEHSWSFESEWLRRTLDRRLVSRHVDLMLAVSREDRRRMIEVEGIDPDAVRFVPNGVPAVEPSGRDVRAELDIRPDGLVVGTVCVLRPEKALDGLVEAAATLREEFPALVVLIVGEGPERERLEEVCRSRGLDGTVRFLGYRDDVPDVLAGLDVAVSCSNREGSSLAIMEYMEAGCPVVATSVGGTPDLIESGVHGLLIEPRNPAALAAGLRELLQDAGLRQRMGRAASERRRREFDIDVTVRTIEDLYGELLAARAAVR